MNTVKYNDTIVFTINDSQYEFRVSDDHLTRGDGSNREIFRVLELDAVDFCSKHYGYKAGSGGWPTSKQGDYKAITRVIVAINELITQKIVENSNYQIY